MGRRELALLVGSTLLTLLVALGALRWLAPALLGGPQDLQLVRTSDEVPPFFEGVFRPEHFATTDFLLKDPRTVNRPRPFHGEVPPLAMGPHDVLGFRNRAVPAVADVVVIGDSQTYGVNAQLEDNWPSQLAQALERPSVYAMAGGGWGAVQYIDMFRNAAAFRPRIVAVAFYSGNDALDSFTVAYGSDDWRELRPDPALTAGAAPAVPFPTPESEWWVPTVAGRPLGFTPTTRLLSNRADPVVHAGYGVIRKTAEAMDRMARQAGIHLVLTVVPTKELVYAPRIAAEGLAPPEAYQELVVAERRNIDALCAYFTTLPATTCVDLVVPMQAAAMTSARLYPESANGHPVAAGYGVIAQAMAAAIAPRVAPRIDGLVVLGGDGDPTSVFLVRDGVAWLFESQELLEANGWKDAAARRVTSRELATLPKRTVVAADPRRFGPRR